MVCADDADGELTTVCVIADPDAEGRREAVGVEEIAGVVGDTSEMLDEIPLGAFDRSGQG